MAQLSQPNITVSVTVNWIFKRNINIWDLIKINFLIFTLKRAGCKHIAEKITKMLHLDILMRKKLGAPKAPKHGRRA